MSTKKAIIQIKDAYDIISFLVVLPFTEMDIAEDIADHLNKDDLTEFNDEFSEEFRSWYIEEYNEIYQANCDQCLSWGQAKPLKLRIDRKKDREELLSLFNESNRDPSPATMARHFLSRKSYEKGLLKVD